MLEAPPRGRALLSALSFGREYLLVEFVVLSALFLIGAKLLYSFYSRGRGAFVEALVHEFIPFSADYDQDDIVVADCNHPYCITLSHHKGNRNPAGLALSDTSTGLVLEALKCSAFWGRDAYLAVQKRYVTSNHFDVDSFLSVWCYINRRQALRYEGVIRHMARIGDFREAYLSPETLARHGPEDHIATIRDAYTALKLCCWLNTLEKRLFTAPYEGRDCQQKFEFFLPLFAKILQDPESAWSDWQQEYTQVVSGFDLLLGPQCYVEQCKDVGLTVLHAPEPLHYYSLFSHSVGSDVVLSMYDGNLYELECKYTQYVEVFSRPVWPRLDMSPLAQVLNKIERDLESNLKWSSARFTDTGPILRLDRTDSKLSKAERYGHPCTRPIFPSSISPADMQGIVCSFFKYGLAHIEPKVGGWTWDDLHTINSRLEWTKWMTECFEEFDRDVDESGGMAVKGPLRQLSALASRRISHSASAGQIFVIPSGEVAPMLSDPSDTLSDTSLKALAGVLPSWYQQRDWTLAYSTHRDGISLQTLLRKVAGRSPTILVVKDAEHHVFGAYASEPWRIAPRFYGTGETFVFQVEPNKNMYMWNADETHPNSSGNDFFQYSNLECIAVGGAGNWAVWLDADLECGSSGPCSTFNSPCLAGHSDFKILVVEVWHIT